MGKYFLLVGWIIWLILPNQLHAQKGDKISSASVPEGTCVNANAILKSVEFFHLQPVPFDRSLSERVFLRWVELIDPAGEYLHATALAKMSVPTTDLIARVKQGDCTFLDEMVKVFQDQVAATLLLTESLESMVLDYQRDDVLTSIDSYHINPDSSFWVDRWRRRMKGQVLDKVYWWNDTLQLSGSDLYQEFLVNEPQWRQTWLEEKRCRIERVASPEESANHVKQAFLQALAGAFDPHTVYFSPQEKDVFEAMLSTDSQSFGVDIGKGSGGDWEIVHLAPGGPAWRSQKLQQEDVVLEITLGDDAPLNLGCLEDSEVAYAILMTEAEEMTLKTRQADGSVKTTRLRKGNVRVEDNTIDAFILEGESKVGYLRLPSFYTSFENDDAPGCSDDVAQEIIRLRRAGVEGIVLDLRFNGGGSLGEALNLAGIFIDYGPLTLQDEDDEVTTLRDWNRGTIFNGPLVVMVNGASASASEILAATLQDWNKAIIVGSKTYGKATGQVVVPAGVSPEMTNVFRRQMIDGDMGFLKVTTSAFYRLDGVPYQREGVVPDVLVPNVWDSLFSKEGEEPYALNTGTVEKTVYFDPFAIPREAIQQKSQHRMEQDTLFLAWQELGQDLGARVAAGVTSPLRWDDYLTREEETFAFFQRINDLSARESEDYTLISLPDDKRVSAYDEVQTEEYTRTRSALQKDPVLEEAYRVILDWLQIEGK